MLSDSKDSQCPEPLAFTLRFRGLLGPALCGWWWWWFRCSVVSGSCNPTDCSLSGSSVHGIMWGSCIYFFPALFSLASWTTWCQLWCYSFGVPLPLLLELVHLPAHDCSWDFRSTSALFDRAVSSCLETVLVFLWGWLCKGVPTYRPPVIPKFLINVSQGSWLHCKTWLKKFYPFSFFDKVFD